MLLNYFKIAIRHFLKQKAFTFFNVLGLAVGLAASLFIFQYTQYEKSFDSFHTKLENLYRVQYNGWQNGKLNFESALAVPPVGPALKNNFPEVEAFTRFYPVNGVIAYESSDHGIVSFYETKMFYADRHIFKMFDFRLAKGHTATCLVGVNKVVVSESVARKYFSYEEPVGGRIKFNGRDFEVTGVFADVPENSHIRFDFLFSMETLSRDMNDLTETGWGWYDFYVYVLLKPGADMSVLQTKWDKWLAENRKAEWEKANAFQEFILKPVSDIHLYSHILYEAQPTEQRDARAVNALGIIAIFILAIAWVNYINLSTARAINRANEVGVRKVVGARHQQLIVQFLAESIILNFIAVMIAIVTVFLMWNSFSSFIGWHIPLDFMYQPEFWGLIVMLFIWGTLFSGFYPAFVLSSFKPAAVLKGKVLRLSGGSQLRKALVVFQFATSVALIIGAYIVFDQVTFMKTKDLGMDISNKLVLRAPVFTDTTYFRRVQSFKDEALRVTGIRSIATANNVPGDEIIWTSHVGRLSGGLKGDLIITSLGIDDQYLTSFDIDVLEGRNFDHQRVKEQNSVLINEALARDLEFTSMKSTIGERLRVRQSMTEYDTFEIVGVVRNHHHLSLQARVIPTIFRHTPWSAYYIVQIESENYKPVIQEMEERWKSFFPGNPFEYFVLEEFFNHQYDKEDRLAKVFTLFTGLAIFIALLGLFGLASFMTIQRTKEIGIRKVLGSPVSDIVWLLTRGFLHPILLATVMGWPIAWYVMSQWLNEFPYRVSINFLVFPLAGLVITTMAFMAIGIQTIKAATVAPVQTLKHE